MDSMRETFECTGAGGNWEYEIDADDPSVQYAWKIWRESWQAAIREAINEFDKSPDNFIERLRKLETPNAD